MQQSKQNILGGHPDVMSWKAFVKGSTKNWVKKN
jgi:hypothetical protein